MLTAATAGNMDSQNLQRLTFTNQPFMVRLAPCMAAAVIGERLGVLSNFYWSNSLSLVLLSDAAALRAQSALNLLSTKQLLQFSVSS